MNKLVLIMSILLILAGCSGMSYAPNDTSKWQAKYDSNPPGATIYVDGRYVGTTPVAHSYPSIGVSAKTIVAKFPSGSEQSLISGYYTFEIHFDFINGKATIREYPSAVSLFAETREVSFEKSNPLTSEVMQRAKSGLEKLETKMPSESTCKVGVLINGTKFTIIDASRDVRMAGLLPGDRIKAIDNESISSAKDLIQKIDQRRVGDLPRFTVERNGDTKEIQVECRDSREYHFQYTEAVNLTSQGKWDECISKTYDLDREWYKAVEHAGIRFDCNEAKRLQTNRQPNLNDAELIYELQRRIIKKAEYSEEDLDQIRGGVLAATSWLESNKFYSFASDLKNQWESATRTTSQQSEPEPAEKSASVSLGTCFVISPNGHIITANHVVDGGKSYKVSLQDKHSFDAETIQTARSTDLAVLKIDTTTPNYLTFISTREVKVGDSIFTMGFPVKTLLGEEPKFNDGSVSALSGIGGEATFFQMSVPIQPGNSGGPVVNNQGQVVGVVTSTAAILPFLKLSGSLPQNINWAVKSDYAMLLFNPPPGLPNTSNRGAAIGRVSRALCSIEVTQ